MTIISSTQKDIKTDQLLLDDSRKSTFTSSAINIFWGALASMALLAAGISYLTTDLDKKSALNTKPQIDTITTASTSSRKRQYTIAQRRKEVFETKAQEQKVDDISRILQRLRGEQTSLNNRIVELEQSLKKTSDRTASLEKELELAPLSLIHI